MRDIQMLYESKMNSPAFRIIAALLFLIVIVTAYSLIVLGNTWGTLIVLLGGAIGPAMGISYPFSALTKILYIAGLVISACIMFFGIKHRSKLLGQAGFVCSLVVWVLLGIFGLSTGT